MGDEEWMCWQVDGEDIDLEAQRRELERLEQAQRDRLVAEELQHDLGVDDSQGQSSVTDPTEIPPPSSHPEALEPLRECWGHHTTDQEPALTFRIPDINAPGPSSLTRSFSPLDTTPSLPTSVQTDGPLSHNVFSDLDKRLAEQLQEEERLEREKRKSQSDRDAELARALQEEEEQQHGGGGEGEGEEMEEGFAAETGNGAELSNIDEQVAHALQQEERGGVGGEGDVLLAQRLQNEESEQLKLAECDEQLAHALQSEQEPPQEDTSHDEELARQIAAQFEATTVNTATTSTAEAGSQGLLARPPNWWTVCPNCPADSNWRYHLIEVGQGENEWLTITSPLEDAGFVPQRLRRVQNMKLYRRLQFEKQSMCEEDAAYNVNERMLYHTSSSSVDAICGEGLDQRLSRKGRFGNGVYFRLYNYHSCNLLLPEI